MAIKLAQEQNIWDITGTSIQIVTKRGYNKNYKEKIKYVLLCSVNL